MIHVFVIVQKYHDAVRRCKQKCTNRTFYPKTVQFFDTLSVWKGYTGMETCPSETISRHIHYLQESFMISEALRYDVKGRKYIGTETKYYFSDMGLRNSILGFRQMEENHLMENIIYNELLFRGFNVDVGMVGLVEINSEGKQERKRLEVDFVANQGCRRYYIQSAFRMDSDEKVRQEKKSMLHVPDSFRKIIVVRDDIAPYHDDDGFLRIGLFDFLLKPDSLDQ